MLTVRQIFDDLAGLVGIEDADLVPESLRERILGDIRAALQVMQQAGEDYYCREELNVSLFNSTASYELPKTIQTILEPARLSTGQPLRQLTSRPQLIDFGPLFLGQISRAVSLATPLAFFAESLGDPASPDSVRILLHIVPTPNSAFTLILNVINEPPTYDLDDLCGVSPSPPVPHKYHESILLPIARYNSQRAGSLSGSSRNFRNLRKITKGP